MLIDPWGDFSSALKCSFGVSGFRGSVAGQGDCNTRDETRFATPPPPPPTLYRAPKQKIWKTPFLRPKNGLWGGPPWTHLTNPSGVFNSSP